MFPIFIKMLCILYQAYLAVPQGGHKFKNLSLVEYNYNNSKGISYTSGFFMLIGLALLGFGVSGGISLLLLSATGKSALEAINDPKNANLLRLIQVVSVLISMFLPAFIVASILNKKPLQLLGYRKDAEIKQVGIVLLIVLTSLFIAGSLGYLNKAIPLPANLKTKFDDAEKSYADQVEMMVNLKNIGGYFVSLLIMAFVPAVCEETLFRGGLQNFLSRATKSPWISIIVVSILFSIVHFSFYGFLPRMFLGFMLGLVFYYTNNIWLSITAHFFNNALAVTAAYFSLQHGKNLKEAMNEDVTVSYWGFVAIPVLILLFVALKKMVNQQNQTHSL